MLPPMLERLREFLRGKGESGRTQEQGLLLAELDNVEKTLETAARKPAGRMLWEEFRRVQEKALLEVCDVPMSLCVCPTCTAATADSPVSVPAAEPAVPEPVAPEPATAPAASPVAAKPSAAIVAPKPQELLIHPASPLKSPHAIRFIHPRSRR